MTSVTPTLKGFQEVKGEYLKSNENMFGDNMASGTSFVTNLLSDLGQSLHLSGSSVLVYKMKGAKF